MNINLDVLTAGLKAEVVGSVNSGNYRQVARDIARVVAAIPEWSSPVSRTDVLLDIVSVVPETYRADVAQNISRLVIEFTEETK